MRTASATATDRPELRWVMVPDADGRQHLEMLWVTHETTKAEPMAVPAAA